LASAQGEEAARRAMPTSSVAGFSLRSATGGGAEAPLGGSQLPWRAAWGNRVRLACFARDSGWRRSVRGFGRSMGEVAIAASLHGKDHIRLLFAVSRDIRFLFARGSLRRRGRSYPEIPAPNRPTRRSGAPILESGEGPGGRRCRKSEYSSWTMIWPVSRH
jgi:hypothetical protein